ncbi:hypothetical protein [Mesorhizobium sp. M1272]|uniref:hypothetical protein n=1 Tax=Mesorhizobium sp. M1272 TaxID=2957074 RepID=UPI0033378F5A
MYANTNTWQTIVLLALFCIFGSPAFAETYVPLLDEYDGVAANDGRYLILPAFENTDPNVRRKAYFIFPKYLQYAGDESGSVKLGVNHIGYSLLPDGSADFAPRLSILATVVAQGDSTTETAIKAELTKRDVAEGFLDPAFPTPTFEQYDINIVTAGLSSYDDKDVTKTIPGGYPGQSFLVKANLFTDANRAFVLDTPSKSGREANLWGVSVQGKIKGYGNRLDCTVDINMKKTYDYFAARASVQAYWGAVGTDVSTEVRKMDDEQVINFGACRGDQEKIDKLVMPVWQIIIDLRNDDGEKMFYQMVKDVSGGTNHPGKSDSGWGFQASARWASVSSKKSVTFNFNVATPIYWTMPMAMSFVSSCKTYQANFINGSNPKKACVDANDAQKIHDAQRKCVINYAKDIANLSVPDDLKQILYKDLIRDGCGFNFTSPIMMMSYPEIEKLRASFEATRERVRKEIIAEGGGH